MSILESCDPAILSIAQWVFSLLRNLSAIAVRRLITHFPKILMSNFDAPYSHANQLPEIGLPNGRGTEIWSVGNTSLQSAQSINGFKSSLFSGNVSGSDSQDYYRIDVSNRTSSSFLMSGLGANVGIQLLDDRGNVVRDSPDHQYSNAKSIRTSLDPGTYYVRVYSIDHRNTHYNLSLVNGTAFYVAPYGNDSNSGDISAPFRTIQHAVNAARAGDTVFVRDGIYYERQISLYHGGAQDRPLTIAGTPGETAVIDNGLSVSGWSSAGGSVFVGRPNYGNGDRIENTMRVVVDNRPLLVVDHWDQLREGTYWRDFSNGNLYVWAFGGVNPSEKETLVLNHRHGNGNHVQDNYGGIAIHSGANHIAIDGLIIRASDTGIWATESAQGWGTDLTVKNSEIKFAWDSAIRFDNWNGALIDNTNIHNNGQILLPNYQRWPHAILGFNSQNVTVSRSKIHHNNGEGVGPFLGSSHWDIHNNVVHDNWSVNIYIDTDLGDVKVSGNYVYNSPETSDPHNQKDGIRIASEYADLDRKTGKHSIDRIHITNNRIEGTGGGIRFFPYAGGNSYLKDSVISGNTIANMIANRDAILVDRADNVRVNDNNAPSWQVRLHDGVTAWNN